MAKRKSSLESLEMTNLTFFKNKCILITGHTGFKGSWLSLWLSSLGAKVYGYALRPPTAPALFDLCRLNTIINSKIADIRDYPALKNYLSKVKPEIIFHMAAQPLVRESYRIPIETYETNVMGTANLLEASRQIKSIRAIINITTDKCYDNKNKSSACFKEGDALGGYDPYSSSKACSEIVTAAYRNSFFNSSEYAKHGVAIATARAGNVIGGGDFAKDRLLPDIFKAILKNTPVFIRYPNATRPWQHVLEPLYGYLLLAKNLYQKGAAFGESYNFGPGKDSEQNVKFIVQNICASWGAKATFIIDKNKHPHEAKYLKLQNTKAKIRLGWKPKLTIYDALDLSCEWWIAYRNKQNILKTTLSQIQEYEAL